MVKEVVVITGGTSGLGKACVERFRQDGYDVVFCGRNTEAGDKIATEFESTFIKCDVTKPEEVQNLFDQVSLLEPEKNRKSSNFKVKEKFGRCDAIINNAGIINDAGKIVDMSLDDYHKIMKVNCDGAFYVLK